DFEVVESVDEVARHIETIVAEGADSFETKHRTKDNEIRFIQVSSRAILLGGRGFILSMWRDITERKQMEEILRKSEKNYRELIEVAQEGIWVIDKDAYTTFVNPRMAEMLGYKVEEMLDKHLFSFMDEEGVGIAKGKLERRKRGIKEEHDFEFVRKDGRRVHAAVATTPLTDDLGNYIGAMAGVMDNTRRKEAQEALERSQEELRTLSSRLAELEETERRRLAHELHDRVGQTLTALGINLHLLLNQLPVGAPDRPRGQLKDSLHQVEEMADCIRDVMYELRPAVLDDYGLLAALKWYGRQHEKRTGVPVEVLGEKTMPRLPRKVETAVFRIVQEALTNVAKHANAKRIIVSLESDDETISLTVLDDGVGFDTTIEKEPTREMGWGLLIMKERALVVGGNVRVESEQGKGTKVIVEIERSLLDDDSSSHG
ncbi:PAS domain S-box protein, partial [Candidatus Hydrogenedentota bacterium]